jgi:hypothetical protein
MSSCPSFHAMAKASSPSACGERGRTAHRQHYGSGPVAQDLLEDGRLERPGDKADTPWLLGLAMGELDLLLAPLETLRRPWRPIAAPADKPETTTVTYGSGQVSAGRAVHGRQCDGVLDRQEVGKGRSQ